MNKERTQEMERDPFDAFDPRQMRKEALEEIVARRESSFKSPDEVHNEAVKHFDYAYKDLTGNPVLLTEVLIERERVKEDAIRKNQVIDWGRKLPEIGDEIRKKAGIPFGPERDRKEVLDEMQAERVQARRDRKEAINATRTGRKQEA